MDGIGHQADQLAGLLLLVGKRLGGHGGDAIHLELLILGIHRLRQSVSEEENSGAGVDFGLLQRVFPVGHETYGDIAVARQFAYASAYQQRGIMAGIAVEQKTGGQVEHTHEERHEHVHLVHVGNRLVDGLHDVVGQRLMGRHGAEGRTRHRHEERGGSTLARHVADAEEQLVVAEIEVEQVATYLLGRCQRGKELHVVAVVLRRELLGQHTHLDVTGNTEVALYRGLLGGGGLQLVDVFHQRLLHIPERLAQLAYLVSTLEVGQHGIKLS